MKSHEISADRDPAFRLWQVYALLSMAAAAGAVWAARNTHPLALLLLSAAVLATGFGALWIHHALSAFLNRQNEAVPLGERTREMLEREKALALRSIKELEFDRATGKIGDADFDVMSAQLRARALALMQDLERTAPVVATVEPRTKSGTECASCHTSNDADAKFCKNCGSRLGVGS